jgi:hypothetical protein
MKTGLETSRPSTGTNKLHCPQCRRNHLVARTGTVTVEVGHGKEKVEKKIPTAFAECKFCGLLSSVEERPFTHQPFIAATFFPGSTNVALG